MCNTVEPRLSGFLNNSKLILNNPKMGVAKYALYNGGILQLF